MVMAIGHLDQITHTECNILVVTYPSPSFGEKCMMELFGGSNAVSLHLMILNAESYKVDRFQKPQILFLNYSLLKPRLTDIK